MQSDLVRSVRRGTKTLRISSEVEEKTGKYTGWTAPVQQYSRSAHKFQDPYKMKKYNIRFAVLNCSCGKNESKQRKKFASIPHHRKQLENLSSSSPALLTASAFSGFKVLSKARLNTTHMRGFLHTGSVLCWYSHGTFRPLDEKCYKSV